MRVTKTAKHLFITRAEGSKCPVVCVLCDDAGRSLHLHLSPDRPVLAFKHLGGDGRRITLTRVETIAKAFVDELTEARPNGPYVLVGYSFGGIVAFEMAQQLMSAGYDVRSLVLIDSYSPRLHEEAMRQGHNFYSGFKELLLHEVVEQRLRKGRALSRRLNHQHIIDTYDRATRAYEANSYPGALAVVKASKGWGPVDMGWHSLAEGGFALETMPCNHYDIVRAQHLPELAESIEEVLRIRQC